MHWYIRDIIIYGREEQIRRVELKPGMNIITGESKAGKSALIPIVDYCLGSQACEVPLGVIREFALWYAIRIQTPQEQIFLARPEPGQNSSTSVMQLLIRENIPYPSIQDLIGNTHRDSVIEELSRRLGLTQEALTLKYENSYTAPPTIRSIIPFLFQPQNVIANKDTLFYKTDQEKGARRQRLQRIFPLVLGAMDEKLFRLRGDFDWTRRELRLLEHSSTEQRSLGTGDSSIAFALWSRAVALGLFDPSPPPLTQRDHELHHNQSLDRAALRDRLTSLVEVVTHLPAVEDLTVHNVERTLLLETESSTIRNELMVLRRQLRDTEGMSQEADQFVGTLRMQSGRLRPLALLQTQTKDHLTCPLCHQQIDDVIPNIGHLQEIHHEIHTQLEKLTIANPSLKARIQELREQITEHRTRLAQVEVELAELYRAEEVNSLLRAWMEQQRLLGAIQFYLEYVPAAIQDASDIESRLKEKHDHLETLTTELENYDSQRLLRDALESVAQIMTELSRELDFEVPNAPLRLDIQRLTIARKSATGKTERLNEIGSGENWVGYHLCALFALHTFFIENQSPVPSFLFIDQLSQIYFPELIGKDQEGRTGDWNAIKKIYQMIFHTVHNLGDQLQVVVLDHANFLDQPEFQAAIRERWREGHKLI